MANFASVYRLPTDMDQGTYMIYWSAIAVGECTFRLCLQRNGASEVLCTAITQGGVASGLYMHAHNLPPGRYELVLEFDGTVQKPSITKMRMAAISYDEEEERKRKEAISYWFDEEEKMPPRDLGLGKRKLDL